MCAYCDPDTREMAAASDRRLADQLRRLAKLHEDLAAGRIKPHNADDMTKVTVLARGVVRKLVEDYI